jgi:hypothetical protein
LESLIGGFFYRGEGVKIVFMASLACLQSAITIGNDGATRVRLDIPESEIAEAVKLVMLKSKAFRVTLEPVENKDNGKKKWADADMGDG